VQRPGQPRRRRRAGRYDAVRGEQAKPELRHSCSSSSRSDSVNGERHSRRTCAISSSVSHAAGSVRSSSSAVGASALPRP
jgi:hypothetical protein